MLGNWVSARNNLMDALGTMLMFKGGEVIGPKVAWIKNKLLLQVKQAAFDVQKLMQGVVNKSPLEMLRNGANGREVVLQGKTVPSSNPALPPVSTMEVSSPADAARQLASDLAVNPDGSITCRNPSDPGGCFVAGTLVHTKEGLKPIEEIRVGDWVLSKPENGAGEQAYKRVTKTFRFENKEVMLLEFFTVAEFERAKLIGDAFDAIRNEMKQYLVATSNHPFWINGVGWTAAYNIDDAVRAGVPTFQTANGDLAHAGYSGTLYREPLATGVAWFEIPEAAEDGVIPVDLDHGEPQADLKWSKLQSREGRKVGMQYPTSTLHQTVYNIEVEDYHTYYVGRMGIWVHNTNCLTGEVTSSAQVSELAKDPASVPTQEMLKTLDASATGFRMTSESLVKYKPDGTPFNGAAFQEQANGAITFTDPSLPNRTNFVVPALMIDPAKYKAETGKTLDQNSVVGDALALMPGKTDAYSKTIIDSSSGNSKYFRDGIFNEPKLLRDLQRISFALRENPGFSWVLEIENQAGFNMVSDYIAKNLAGQSWFSKDFYLAHAEPLVNGALKRQLPDNLTGFAKGVDAAGNVVWGAVGVNKLDVLRSLDDGSLAQQAACFAYGTMVWLSAERTDWIEIQFIEPGMEVLSRCEKTGEMRGCKVIKTFERENVGYYHVRYVDEEGQNYTIGTTPEHPFWIREQGWTEVRNLKPGQVLELATGETATITEVEDTGKKTIVYNIEVEGFHTYFVDYAGVWVHNKNVTPIPDLASVSGRTSVYGDPSFENYLATDSKGNTGWLAEQIAKPLIESATGITFNDIIRNGSNHGPDLFAIVPPENGNPPLGPLPFSLEEPLGPLPFSLGFAMMNNAEITQNSICRNPSPHNPAWQSSR